MTFLTITTAMLLLAAVRLCSSLILHHHHDAKSSFAIVNRHLNLSQRCQLKLMMAGSSSSTTTTVSTPQEPPTATPRRIFCYGDSLTTGTSPPYDELFPYGPHLEQELNRLYSNNNNDQNDAVIVRWRGLPGWTANTMVQYVTDTSYGLQSVLDSIRNPSVSLVIILAGTNDIGLLTSSSSMPSSSSSSNAKEAVEPILKLHQTCLDCQKDEHETNLNIHTLAIGIPTSAWQSMNSNAAKLCDDMNNALQTFASNEDRVTYIDFPFTYDEKRDKSNWSCDGLHFSPVGYETLGKALAPCVKEILDTL